jgi:hypothetical protein
MKFSPVRIDEKPVMKMPMPTGRTLVTDPCVLYGV